MGTYLCNFIWQIIIYSVSYEDGSFKELFDHINEDTGFPVSVEYQELIISITLPIYSVLIHYLLKEYDREDYDFFIGTEN